MPTLEQAGALLIAAAIGALFTNTFAHIVMKGLLHDRRDRYEEWRAHQRNATVVIAAIGLIGFLLFLLHHWR